MKKRERNGCLNGLLIMNEMRRSKED